MHSYSRAVRLTALFPSENPMRAFLKELWRTIAPILFIVVMPFVLIGVGAGMIWLGSALPWDLMMEAGFIVAAVGVVWIGFVVVRVLFSE